MFYHLFVDSTNCSGFRKYSCGFREFASFWSDFERYNDLGICLWNPKKHRRSKKSSNDADSATNLIWPVADSAYNAENAKLGLVMIEGDRNHVSHKTIYHSSNEIKKSY